MPPRPHGIVIFAHGSGSSRLSPRNRMVADHLTRGGFGTLLFDLLTEREEAGDKTGRLRFAIDFLAGRLIEVTDWVVSLPVNLALPLGYFGASTGAAAALVAAVSRSALIGAIVSRGGRPDLAGSALGEVRAPTLLLVGGEDAPVIGLNQEAFERMRYPKELRIIPGASHLFEEPGTLEQVAELAAEWFEQHLGGKCSESTQG